MPPEPCKEVIRIYKRKPSEYIMLKIKRVYPRNLVGSSVSYSKGLSYKVKENYGIEKGLEKLDEEVEDV